MAVAIGSGTLHFPDQSTIIAYLSKHPLTKHTKNKIIKTVAKYFANVETGPKGVDTGVLACLCDPKLLKPKMNFIVIKANLYCALKDCANEKTIPLVKKIYRSHKMSIRPLESSQPITVSRDLLDGYKNALQETTTTFEAERDCYQETIRTLEQTAETLAQRVEVGDKCNIRVLSLFKKILKEREEHESSLRRKRQILGAATGAVFGGLEAALAFSADAVAIAGGVVGGLILGTIVATIYDIFHPEGQNDEESIKKIQEEIERMRAEMG